MLMIPDVAGLPIFEGRVNELIEDVVLVIIDVKNIRIIITGQVTVSLRYAK